MFTPQVAFIRDLKVQGFQPSFW